MMTPTLKEAKRLHSLGFAILWIKPKSKAPVKSQWTTGPRDNWEDLERQYRPGFNVGVRLGSPSKVNGKYLAVIDIDVKSKDAAHYSEVITAIRELFPSLPANKIVQVASGRGNGSSHLYIVSPAPLQPAKLRTSSTRVKVMMPSAPVGKAQRGWLSEGDIKKGYRIRPAWEIALMGEGQQVVLPPSTHPDSGHEYRWRNPLKLASDLIEVKINGNLKNEGIERSTTNDWQPEPVDLVMTELHKDIIEDLLYADTDDRSATVFKVAIAMVREGFTDRQIMSVLTDKNYELGKVAFEHAKTDSRARAANWVFNYTLKKARTEADARLRFSEEVEELPPLTADAALAQLNELVPQVPWQELIERHQSKGVNGGLPKSTLKNLLLIFTNEVAVDVFRRDDFSIRDFYGHATPWGGKKGRAITDDDAIKIKVWLSHTYHFEPKRDLIYEAMTYLSEKNSFDPVREWLESLPEWDGTNRLDTWLVENFEAEGDSEYLAQVFRKWVVAMVMRDYLPGTKFDWMPIFEGRQGVGKSSIGRLLVGDKYFLDWLPDLSNKDAALSLQGAWAVEFGELASLRKQELEPAKAFITRTMDKFRPPYGRKLIEAPRRCVFYGTTNSDMYLRDDSGNRRFKPVKVGQLDFKALERDRTQLFAEALWIFKNGLETPETLEIEGKAREYEQKIQDEKMVEDDATTMKELLIEFMGKSAEEIERSGVNFSKFKIRDLFETYGPFNDKKGDTRSHHFAAKAIKALGGKKWKSNGINYWNLKPALGDTTGIPKNRHIPIKNLSLFNN